MAVVLAGAVAAVVGFFCVRLTQIYFAMLTLAFAMLVWGVAFKWKEVTGGDDGFTGVSDAGTHLHTRSAISTSRWPWWRLGISRRCG